LEQIGTGTDFGSYEDALESSTRLLTYIGELVSALAPPASGRATTPPWDNDSPIDQDPDFDDNQPHIDEDSAAEDSVGAQSFEIGYYYNFQNDKMIGRGNHSLTLIFYIPQHSRIITFEMILLFFCFN